ncbi:MAG: ABC transporter permease [Bacillota bacterium]|nr:ABC transporter permease [Bacillota bacterium]
MNSIKIAANFARRILREYQALALMLILPLFTGVIAVNISTNYSIDKVGITDKIDKSHPLVKQIEETGKFEVKFINEKEMNDKIINKEINIGIVIPDKFGKNKSPDKEPFKVVCLIQNANVIFLRLLIDGYVRKILNIKTPSHIINVQSNIVAQKTSLGFFLLFILLFSGTCTELLLEDKKDKTYIRYFCAPVKEAEIYIGAFITNLVLGTVQIVFFLLVSKIIFNFDWKVPVMYVFTILVTFLITSIGISIGLVGFIKDSKVYSFANALIAIFTCFFGGSYFSSSLMGENLDKIANLFPQKWATQAYEKLANGQSFADIGQNLIIMLLFAAVLFTFGINTLRPSEADL